jgi:site-specific recombinase XerD
MSERGAPMSAVAFRRMVTRLGPAAKMPFGIHPHMLRHSEAIMLAHGFKIELLVELVRAGLATASTERMLASGRPMEITRLRITGAGRRALAQVRWP